jgi:ABC-2 type transport system ATP-binding protein
MLAIKNLSKRFGDLRALEQVSFEVSNKSIVGIIGPNGAGKTTLLLSLAGLLPVDSGTIHWNGQPIPVDSRSRAIFYVEDAIRPHAYLSVDAVLNFYAAVFQRTEKRLLDELIDLLALRAFLRSRVSALSKGATKRFLLAIGLLSIQPILMLDEPFDGLDLKQTMELIPLLRQVSVEGRSLVLSIHQLKDAERVCDQFVLLNNGRLAGRGTLAELQTIARRAQSAGLEEIFLALT